MTYEKKLELELGGGFDKLSEDELKELRNNYKTAVTTRQSEFGYQGTDVATNDFLLYCFIHYGLEDFVQIMLKMVSPYYYGELDKEFNNDYCVLSLIERYYDIEGIKPYAEKKIKDIIEGRSLI